MMYFSIFSIYIVLLNLVTSYRLFRDEYYNTLQKSMQYLFIWCLPIAGSFAVAFFLNQDMQKKRKYPWIVRVVAGLFMVKLVKDTHGFGYPSSMNDNGGYDGSVSFMETSCGDGGCGGD